MGEHGEINRPFRDGALNNSPQGVRSYAILLATTPKRPLDLSEAFKLECSETTRS